MSTKAVEDGASERGGGGVHSYSTKASSLSMGDLSTRCEDTRTAALSLSMLNVGYSSTSLGNCGREGELEGAGGRGVREEEERGTLAPETPQRAARPNPGEGEKGGSLEWCNYLDKDCLPMLSILVTFMRGRPPPPGSLAPCFLHNLTHCCSSTRYNFQIFCQIYYLLANKPI